MSQDTDAITEKCGKFIQQLFEHHNISGIRIFVTAKDGPYIWGNDIGNGDFYSIEGFIQKWMARQDERVRINEREIQKSRDQDDSQEDAQP